MEVVMLEDRAFLSKRQAAIRDLYDSLVILAVLIAYFGFALHSLLTDSTHSDTFRISFAFVYGLFGGPYFLWILKILRKNIWLIRLAKEEGAETSASSG